MMRTRPAAAKGVFQGELRMRAKQLAGVAAVSKMPTARKMLR
jgi:hypothetical protein